MTAELCTAGNSLARIQRLFSCRKQALCCFGRIAEQRLMCGQLECSGLVDRLLLLLMLALVHQEFMVVAGGRKVGLIGRVVTSGTFLNYLKKPTGSID